MRCLGKIRYETRDDADTALATVSTAWRQWKNRRSRKDGAPDGRVYDCEICDGFHLTSMSLLTWVRTSHLTRSIREAAGPEPLRSDDEATSVVPEDGEQ